MQRNSPLISVYTLTTVWLLWNFYWLVFYRELFYAILSCRTLDWVYTEQSLSVSQLAQSLANFLSPLSPPFSLSFSLHFPSLPPSTHTRSSENVCWRGRSPSPGVQSQEHHSSSIGSNPQLFRRQFTAFLFQPAPAEAGGSEGAVYERRLHGGLHIPPLWGNHGNKSKGELEKVYIIPAHPKMGLGMRLWWNEEI